MQTARILLPILALVASASSCGAAQELKTVSECRNYREAWFTSENNDIRALSARELVSRAQEMMICARDIDKEPFEQGMTCDDAIKAGVFNTYAILSSAYYEEVYRRATSFLDRKNLSTAFITDDAKRHY